MSPVSLITCYSVCSIIDAWLSRVAASKTILELSLPFSCDGRLRQGASSWADSSGSVDADLGPNARRFRAGNKPTTNRTSKVREAVGRGGFGGGEAVQEL